LHHVPDALSRMYEVDEIENTVTAAISAVNLMTKDIVDIENTQDEWYRKRYKEVVSSPERYKQWKIVDQSVVFPETKVGNVGDSRRSRSLEISFSERIS